MKPDLDPSEIDAMIARNDQLVRDTDKLLAGDCEDDADFRPTALDVAMACFVGAAAIVAAGVLIGIAFNVFRFAFGG